MCVCVGDGGQEALSGMHCRVRRVLECLASWVAVVSTA